MQSKRVIWTIAALIVAGVAVVILLGRTPAVDTSTPETEIAAATTPAETATPATDGEQTTEQAAPAETEEAAGNPDAAAIVAADAEKDAAIEPAASADTAKPAEAEKSATSEAAPAAKKDDLSLLNAPAGLAIDIKKAMEERSVGSAAAPVTVIEYASLTCPHCAHFTNTVLPDVKKQLIETGKLRLIFRDFPLDGVAMKAAMMARCADHDKYFDLLEVIFKDQERWIQSEDPAQALAQLGTLAGMDNDYIKACMANTDLQAAILKNLQDGQKSFKIEATPTFIFNNGADQFSGGQSIEKFTATVNKLSSGK